VYGNCCDYLVLILVAYYSISLHIWIDIYIYIKGPFQHNSGGVAVFFCYN